MRNPYFEKLIEAKALIATTPPCHPDGSIMIRHLKTGQCIDVSPETGAVALATGNHRIATEAEIAEHRILMDKQTQAIIAGNNARKGSADLQAITDAMSKILAERGGK